MRTGPHTWLCQGLCLLLPLLLEDSAAQDVLFRPDWGFHSYEITIPRRLGFHVGPRGSVQQLTYLLPLGGKKHVLRLRPQRLLLPRHLRVFSFTQRGELVEDQPYVPGDCNFVGSLEGAQDSRATLSTCTGGLRGVLSIDARDFQIEPLRASSAFEHVVYLLEDPGRLLNQTCDVAEDGEARSFLGHGDLKARVRNTETSYKHTRYMELVFVFDHDRYLYSKSNLTQVTSDAMLIGGILDTYYQTIYVRVHLKAVEVWTEGNKINLNDDKINSALQAFVLYRNQTLLRQIPHDWAHIFVSRTFVKGAAFYTGHMCHPDSASITVLKGRNLLRPSAWTTHEIGHSMGMSHDTPECVCNGRRGCIMAAGQGDVGHGFSNCSYEEFLDFVSQEAACLNNIPVNRPYVPEKCGNKIVEDDEQCDCGSKEDCENDQCCQLDCRFKEGTDCSGGPCCHNCRLRPLGHLCRKEENECDLPEYCTGNSSVCPEDTYKADGTPCRYKGRCFKKTCPSRYVQCQRIFGPGVREAPFQCYHTLNVLGDQFGNCGMRDFVYAKCSQEHSLCGRVQCVNIKALPDLADHSYIMSTHLQKENVRCWSVGYHFGMEPLGIPDSGVILDGTSCGTNRVCVNGTCMPDKTVLVPDDCSVKCNRRGVCNNKNHCHCTDGWAPPSCEDKGLGGSIDSGSPTTPEIKVSGSVKGVSIMLLRLILFGISTVSLFFKLFLGYH